MTADIRRATRATRAVLTAALAGVAAVWILAAWWSFAEQTLAARHLGFTHPAVLPWTLDGLAFALALVALAAALDGRPAPAARAGVFLALAGSIWTNRLGVQIRLPNDETGNAVRVSAVAPLSAFVAFEVILAAVRRLVLRWRGLPAPAPIPPLRPVRLLLAPWAALTQWRTAVLNVTSLDGPGPDSPAVHMAGAPAASAAGRVELHPAGLEPVSGPEPPPPGPDTVPPLYTPTIPARPHGHEAAVYRFYDGEGSLLYVGCTIHPSIRFRAHQRRQPWWDEVTASETMWVPTVAVAAEMEWKAIRDEYPVYNVGLSRYAIRPPLSAAPVLPAVEERVEVPAENPAEEPSVEAEDAGDRPVPTRVESAGLTVTILPDCPGPKSDRISDRKSDGKPSGRRSGTARRRRPLASDIMAELGVGKSRAYDLAKDPAALARARAARHPAVNGHRP